MENTKENRRQSAEKIEGRKKGWNDETEKRQDIALDFLKEHFFSGPDDREDYKSGEMVLKKDFQKIVPLLNELEAVRSVEIKYRKEEPIEARILLGKKDRTPINLTGRALQHFLETPHYE